MQLPNIDELGEMIHSDFDKLRRGRLLTKKVNEWKGSSGRDDDGLLERWLRARGRQGRALILIF
jgi:hypothetical protein